MNDLAEINNKISEFLWGIMTNTASFNMTDENKKEMLNITNEIEAIYLDYFKKHHADFIKGKESEIARQMCRLCPIEMTCKIKKSKDTCSAIRNMISLLSEQEGK